MNKHPSLQESFGMSSTEIAYKISRLRYDEFAMLLRDLSKKILDDSKKDAGRGRKNLAKDLKKIADCLGIAGDSCDKAWKICAPYMKSKTS